MPAVKCSVGGCGTRLQPHTKVDPRDRDTWIYPECDLCFRPVCGKHAQALGGKVVCDDCRPKTGGATPGLTDLGLGPLDRGR